MYGAGAGAAWSRLFFPGAGAGADPSRSEPESAPGPLPSGAGAGAAQKSGGSATLLITRLRLNNCRQSVAQPDPVGSAYFCQKRNFRNVSVYAKFLATGPQFKKKIPVP